MLSPCHQPLIDDLRRVVAARIDVYTFLYNRVRPRAERLANLVPAWLYLRLRRSLCGAIVGRAHLCRGHYDRQAAEYE